jgi:hypothetical protein
MGDLLRIGLLIVGLVLAVAWIILPFALIGTKPLLQELIDETKRTNELLANRPAPVPPQPEAAEPPPRVPEPFPKARPGARPPWEKS